MDRRNFFKIVSTVSAGVATNACGKKEDVVIPLLVPSHQGAPGEEHWHPSVCTECNAGCGTIARIMEGERIIERNGQKFRQQIACVKKLEGNPLDAVSGGRLCARGQAALQSLYNPDRVTGPLRRTAARGRAGFAPVPWDEAIALVVNELAKARSTDPRRILFLTTAPAGSRLANIQSFLESIGAPPALSCSLTEFAIERQAAAAVFGSEEIPRYDVANARYVLGAGADFLGGWTSPVYYARQYGRFRQGRQGIRGKLVQAESRMSLTASNADEWLPLRPGSEPYLLLATAQILLDEKLARGAERLPPGVRDSLRANDPGDLIRVTGIEERRIRRIAHELGESEAPLVIAGASVVHSNSYAALIAGHYLNLLLGNFGQPGGIFSSPPSPGSHPNFANVPDALKRAQILLIDHANPVYMFPSASGVAERLNSLDAIFSFGMFINDSSAYADAFLPSHHALETELAVAPVVAPSIAINVAVPFVQPLHNTRPLEQTLAAIASKMKITFQPVTAQAFVQRFLPSDQTWEQVARDGGLWHDEGAKPIVPKPTIEKLALNKPVFAGSADDFPFQFQPYLSLQYRDGEGANLPWMQELPDPSSSAMWYLPVEIDPQTALRLNIATGDRVRVESPHGKLEAAAYVHPAALPGVVSMGIGEGHTHYGRYASSRGANPLSILAPIFEEASGALAFGATRVRIARLDRPAGLTQFSPNDREQGPWGYR